MRHRMRGRQLNRTTNQRKALLRGLAKDLIRHEQITTTLPKAKDLRPFVEKLVTLGRRGGLHVYRQALSVLGDNELARKLTGTLAERYRDRAGGYTRIVKAGFRYGDNAPLAVIEFIERDAAAKGAGQKVAAPSMATDAAAEAQA
ncbi:MAG: 50S ribosomal protein L17 [Candidatus Paracaedimonas acanthamoebae]|uniref:Large ribosomal subunit protein bL17 n=1 Tax=Candidatus Paracaedimonas acanthamoebae TaxID=244581 RepID=A0A8J7PXU2_9PROT|nr:50S ribosomal protein L17 [Candidatus Paracaedimonas acanthamoebae]